MRTRPLLARLILAALLAACCDTRPDREGANNVLDPDNPSTLGNPYGLEVEYKNETVVLKWDSVRLPGLQGYTILRGTGPDSAFARVDTAAATETRWTDPSPIRFSTSIYRIVAIGGDGSEADTTGRPPVAIDVPPAVRIAGGATSTASRTVRLSIDAGTADRMILSEDTLFAGAEWETYDTSRTWTLSEGKGTKWIHLRATRGETDTSVVASDSIVTASARGSLVLAGGDTATARVRVGVAVLADTVVQIILSPDTLFGDAGDSTYAIDGPVRPDTLRTTWTFGADLSMKRLYARFWNEFGTDTTIADSVRPDDLSNVSVLLAGGDTAASVCAVSLRVAARATVMNVSSSLDFPGENWEPFRAETTFEIGDTAGTYFVWVQLANDFVPLMESAASDHIRFVPIPLALVIQEPADSAAVAEGDTVDIVGNVVAASCREAPDSVEVRIGETVRRTANTGAGWALSWVVDENQADTVEVRITASATDQADSTASDTVRVFVAPSE
jgi:type 1 fimbria pilin